MRIVLVFLICLFISDLTHIQARLIDNSLNVYVNYLSGRFYGSQTINKKSYITPSLYSNLKELTGFSIKGVKKQNAYLSYGLRYEFESAFDWTASNYSDFNGAEIQLHSIAPIIQLHSKFSTIGVANRLKAFGELGPVVGVSRLSLTGILWDIRTDNDEVLFHPMRDSSIFWGIIGTGGLEYALSQSVGCFFSCSLSSNWVSSKFYSDSNFLFSSVNVGVFVKLSKNKLFYDL